MQDNHGGNHIDTHCGLDVVLGFIGGRVEEGGFTHLYITDQNYLDIESFYFYILVPTFLIY